MAGKWVALAASFAALMASTAMAQSLEEKKAAKLKEAWLQNGEWTTDYDKARKKSEETGRPIFAYFTRSYSP